MQWKVFTLPREHDVGVAFITYFVSQVFCAEYPVFLKEHEAGMYRVPVYFACKSLAELPLFVVTPLIFTTCVYFLVGLTAGLGKFLAACGVTVLVANAACSFGEKNPSFFFFWSHQCRFEGSFH